MQYEHCATAMCVCTYVFIFYLVIDIGCMIACHCMLRWTLAFELFLYPLVIGLDRPHNFVFSKLIQLMA